MNLIRGTYLDLLRRDEWRSKRQRILERDENRCRNCGSSKGLQVHHRQYHVCKVTSKKLAPWCYDERYLVTLCETCHKYGHHHHRIPVFTV